MNRRAVVFAVAASFLAGCSRLLPGDSQPRVLEAVAAREKPPAAKATPREEVKNPTVREALEGVCDEGESRSVVRVTGAEAEATEEALRELPFYSAEGDSEYDYGHYVECDGEYAVVVLLIED